MRDFEPVLEPGSKEALHSLQTLRLAHCAPGTPAESWRPTYIPIAATLGGLQVPQVAGYPKLLSQRHQAFAQAPAGSRPLLDVSLQVSVTMT
jgi:hypothetical protein